MYTHQSCCKIALLKWLLMLVSFVFGFFFPPFYAFVYLSLEDHKIILIRDVNFCLGS